MERINLVIDKDTKEKLRILSALEGKSISYITRKVLNEHFKKYDWDIRKILGDILNMQMNNLPEEKMSREDEEDIKKISEEDIVSNKVIERKLFALLQ